MRFDKNFGLVIYRHLVRCYGYYSNRSRGARRLVEKGNEPAASIGSYVVTISTNGHAITEVTGERDGMIQDCWMTNIDADESAEVLLFSRSAGSGGYAKLYAYKFAGDQLQAMELPDPGPNLMEGYQGRDSYELTDSKLFRKFLIYLQDDSNCCPGGGDRVIEFDSATNAWILSASQPQTP